MLPSTSFAVLLLVALIPGYAYLRLTEDARRPRKDSALEEFLEVLTVGLLTTGVAAVLFVLVWPEEVADTLRGASLDSPETLRRTFLIFAAMAGLALGLACLGAWLTRRRGGGKYAPNVWSSTLGMRRDGHIPYVVLVLKDNDRPRIQGVLHSYTTLDGDNPRDIALMSPKLSRNGSTWNAAADYVVISAEEIREVWMTLAPDPGQAKSV